MNQVARWSDFDVALRGSPAPGVAIHDPRRELRIGAIIAVLFFVLFVGWAAFAPMDAAAYAPGQLQVFGQRQSVQHRDGGIVAAIHVREGQKVRAGDVLIELSGGARAGLVCDGIRRHRTRAAARPTTPACRDRYPVSPARRPR